MSGPNPGALRKNVQLEDEPGRPFAVPSPPRRRPAVLGDAILEQAPGTSARRALQTGFALAVQALIVGAMLLIPLLFTQQIDLGQFENTFLVAPPPPAPPPPAAPLHQQAVMPKQPMLQAQLTAPTVIPKKIDATPSAPAMAPQISGVDGGVPGGIAGGVLGGVLAGPAPPPAPPAAKPKGPIRIFSGMKPPALLYAPPLVYPLIAKENHIMGNVIIEAVIDEHGNVTQARVVSGPALLVESALRAVLHRRYAPTILDGQPVSIRFNVTVTFRLG